MGKVCKSCGNYYSGNYCDKCGYGKKTGIPQSVKKYRKAAKNKPERFRTAEDKKIYAKWEREEQAERAERVHDPAAGRNFMIAVIIAAAAVIFLALYQTGAIFSNTRNEVVEQYFASIQNSDFNKFVKCFPKEIKQDYENDRRVSGLSGTDYMNALYADFAESYGDDYEINVVFGSETELDAADYDMTDYRAQYGSAPKLKEVYEMSVGVDFIGSKDRYSTRLYIYVGQTGGYWRIFGISEDLGTMTEENTAEGYEPNNSSEEN